MDIIRNTLNRLMPGMRETVPQTTASAVAELEGPEVEIFIDTESSKLVADPKELERWMELVSTLTLEGQKTLTKEGKSPIPFPLMSEGMIRVYETLCPSKTKIEGYHGTAIPVRVLEAAALCRREGYFPDGLMVWADEKQPDPILVGLAPNPDRTWSKKQYLIARWGDQLRSFAELRKMAVEREKAERITKLQRARREIDGQLEEITPTVEAYIDGGSYPYIQT